MHTTDLGDTPEFLYGTNFLKTLWTQLVAVTEQDFEFTTHRGFPVAPSNGFYCAMILSSW